MFGEWLWAYFKRWIADFNAAIAVSHLVKLNARKQSFNVQVQLCARRSFTLGPPDQFLGESSLVEHLEDCR